MRDSTTHVWKWDHQTHFLALSGWLPQAWPWTLYLWPNVPNAWAILWSYMITNSDMLTSTPKHANREAYHLLTNLYKLSRDRFWIWLDVWLIGWTPPPTKALNVGLWDACCTSGCAPIWKLYLLNINQSINQTIIQWKHVPKIGGCSYNNEKQQYICITYI